ncbi:APC family permease [Gluconacetobacter diazotrophicus]|uniref:Putative cationic amino acid transporter n=1 Tax=Gluconacetobacter diazotrophicus (strain ATCC 49037 / DSM 5601 / CCUG 37298 / CIP 103539 / LMG 7603 / PAl5) TaxID=272568 RepID=A9HI75_GLUDA|nr:amino acid permease [Gluconacetobacter diazotrophicus]CAP55732.1 putative cationic amino acid transporter [Gluconacetobacter diazotrophicus PA1 5]
MSLISFSSKRLRLRKSIQQIESESQNHGLRRTLGPVQLMMLGIGSTIGAGIYVMTGTAAATYAGPAILLSFLVAGLACLFTAFSYGELASTMPVSGSAYSYAYVSMGEGVAWAVGWLLLLEYGISCAGVAAGFSGYATSLLHDLGVHVPSFLCTTLVQTVPTPHGASLLVAPRMGLVGAVSVLVVTGLLVLGVEESARINTLIVFVKVGVLMLFMAFGIRYVHLSNLNPFIPPRENGFHYGVPGIFRAASVIFFAYVGFETVSTASAEARNPRRDVPLGIIGSLLICTLVYICVATVLIGVVPFRQLGVADPLAIAVDAIGQPWLAIMIKVGAVVGLCSVILGLLYGQTRIFFTIARDGLLPPIFCRLHPTFRTPWVGTIVLGVLVAVATATLPIDIISDLVSLGTATAFGIVCFTVIWQRNARPDLHRPFSVPLGGVKVGGVWIGVAPALGILFCLIMAGPLFVDMIRALTNGDPLPAILLGSYIVLGVLSYAFYGHSHSRLGREEVAL